MANRFLRPHPGRLRNRTQPHRSTSPAQVRLCEATSTERRRSRPVRIITLSLTPTKTDNVPQLANEACYGKASAPLDKSPRPMAQLEGKRPNTHGEEVIQVPERSSEAHNTEERSIWHKLKEDGQT